MKDREGYIYFLVGPNNLCKIGKSKHFPTERVAEFTPKLPFETDLLHIVGCLDRSSAENEAHRIFKDKHVRGEWFALDDIDLHAIQCGALDHLEITFSGIDESDE